MMGKIIELDDIESDEISQKAQCLVHFTYIFSDKRLIVLDIQGQHINRMTQKL